MSSRPTSRTRSSNSAPVCGRISRRSAYPFSMGESFDRSTISSPLRLERWNKVGSTRPYSRRSDLSPGLNCVALRSSRRRLAGSRTISRRSCGFPPRRGPAPNPCCRARAHGGRCAAPGLPGWRRTCRGRSHARKRVSTDWSRRRAGHRHGRASVSTSITVRRSPTGLSRQYRAVCHSRVFSRIMRARLSSSSSSLMAFTS